MNKGSESVRKPGDQNSSRNEERITSDRERINSLEKALKHVYSSNGYRVYEALTFIKTCIANGPDEIVRFRHLKGIDQMLSVITKVNEKCLGLVLSILGNCCSEEKSCYKIAQCEGIDILAADVVLKSLTTDSLRNRFCRLIGGLAAHDSCCILIHDKPDIIKALVGFLAGDADSDCRQAVCKTIRVLADNDDHLDAVLRWQALRSVALLLKVNDNDLIDNDLIMPTLRTVSHFMKRCTEECVRQLVSGETIQSLAFLATKNENPDITRYSMSLLLKSSMIKNLRPYLGFNGAIEIFTRSAESIMETKTLRSRDLKQLYHLINAVCLCCRDCANRIKIREVGGLALLIRALKTEQLGQIFDRVISSLVCFDYYVEGLEMLCTAEVFEVLVTHLYRCMKESPGKNLEASTFEADTKDLRTGERKRGNMAPEELDMNECFLPLNGEVFDEEVQLEDAGVRSLAVADENTKEGNAFDEDDVMNINEADKSTVDEEVKRIDGNDEEVMEINMALEIDCSRTEVRRGRGLPRYSIHSPTYKAVLSELKSDDIDELNPRNMWEGVELYGGKKNRSNVTSPAKSNSPLFSSSSGSSPPHGPYSPLSISSYTNSDSISEGSDQVIGQSGGLSPCFLESDGSCLSPLRGETDLPGVAYPPWFPVPVRSCGSESVTSASVPGEEALAFVDSAACSSQLKGEPTQDGVSKDFEKLTPDDAFEEEKETVAMSYVENDADDLSAYNSKAFRRRRHFDKMLEKYEGAFDSGGVSAPVPGELETKLEKRKRSLSAETLRKIQKTVEGDIKRGPQSCINLEEMVSRPKSSSSSRHRKQRMSAERVTALNILHIFWRALDLGNSTEVLCSRRVIQAVLDYLNHSRPPSRRASRFLLRLTQNVNCFEALLRNGIPLLFLEYLNLDFLTGAAVSTHPVCKEKDGWMEEKVTGSGVESCRFSNSDDEQEVGDVSERDEEKESLTEKQKTDLYEELLCNLSIVAQSSFAEGVLSGILKRGRQSDREQCTVQLCLVARSHAMRKQYLLKMGSLNLLIGTLSNPKSTLFPPSVLTVCCLFNQLSIVLDLQRSDTNERTDHSAGEKRRPDDDISFLLENGAHVTANRAEMASSSEVFSALLTGSFAESAMSVIPLPKVSAEAFQFLVEMIRNEPISRAVERLDAEVYCVSEVLLEVLRLANQYLVYDVCERVGRHMCRWFLGQENVEEVFGLCCSLHCTLVSFQCVAYVFSALTPRTDACRLVEKMVSGVWGKEFLAVLTTVLNDALQSS